jgi:hypothetical protein
MVNDMIDGLKLVADGIESVKTIAEAVKSGKDYIKSKHPQVRSDLRAMVGELGKRQEPYCDQTGLCGVNALSVRHFQRR